MVTGKLVWSKPPHKRRLPAVRLGRVTLLAVIAMATHVHADPTADSQALAKARAAKTVGPIDTQNNCASCHELEAEAWRHSRHGAGFRDRHRSKRAKKVLRNMGQNSMKRGTSTNTCIQCHYTSTLKRNRVMPTWGVSCESCHGPAADWVDIHDKVDGDPHGQALQWGEGKRQTPDQRRARLDAARAQGMVHSDMLYQIATACYSCHAVPNETLVNTGDHRAGSQMDLVSWVDGEVRHNFASSLGAPDRPTNRAVSLQQRRRMYVVGTMVDLEFSLRNLAQVTQRGKKFHRAMTGRVKRLRAKAQAIVAAVDIPELAAVIRQIPDPLDDPASVSADLLRDLSQASRRFSETNDGSQLDALDDQIPKDVRGEVHWASPNGG